MKRGRRTRPAAHWFVYMLECRGGRLYTGVAVDVAARFAQHCAGSGAAFTRGFKPLRVLAQVRCADRSAALKAEYALKRLSRADKLRWVARPRAEVC